MIEIKNLSKKFGDKTALDIEEYHIAAGEMIGLVGNNGAGKTTLFRLMVDLLEATTGEVEINGMNVRDTEDWKDITGIFIDKGFLIDYLTAEEYFYFVGKLYGMNQKEVDERLEPYKAFMKEEVLDQKKYIRSFSAGNAQKVGIIAAMLHEPKVLILDEPFNFLDPSSQEAIKRLLKNYNERTGATVIVSSHNLNHTIDICPRIALLEKGKLIKDLKADKAELTKELSDYFSI